MMVTSVAEELGIKVGDFFVCSWGWEQTNIDFYKVVGLTAKGVKLQKWQSQRIGGSFSSDAMVPGDGPKMNHNYTKSGVYEGLAPAKPFQKKLLSYQMGDRINVYVNLTSYSSASPLDGRIYHQTAAGFGH